MAATPQHIVLLYLQREKREETHSGFTLSQKLIATFQKCQIFATFRKNKRQDDKKIMCLIKRRNVHGGEGKIGSNSHRIITE